MMEWLGMAAGSLPAPAVFVTAVLASVAVLLGARSPVNAGVTWVRRLRMMRSRQRLGGLWQQKTEWEALCKFGRQVSWSLSLAQTGGSALAGITEVVPCDLAFLFLQHGERLVLSGVVPEGSGRIRLGLVPDHHTGSCLCGHAVAEKKPVYARDIWRDRRCTQPECKLAGVRSLAVIPLCHGGEVLGVIGLATDAECDFARQGDFLCALAGQVALAIANARQYEALQHELAERRRIEASLTESNRKYQQLVENARDGICTLDNDGRFVFVNAELCQLLGYGREELLQRSMADTFSADERQDGMLRLTRLACGRSVRIERAMVCKDGHTVMVECNIWRADEGSIKAIIRDVSERQQALEQRARLEMALRQREKMDAVGQLVGGIAHNFNNQLGGIMGAAELLGLEVTGGKQRQHLNQILQATGRAADLTQQLLAFARKGKVRNEALDMHAVIQEVMALLERSIDKCIRMRSELHAPHGRVMGDPSQLQSALLSLALNARDAMPAGGELVFATALVDRLPVPEGRPGDYLRISVRDTGTGMSEEVKKRLFEPFFTTKEVGKGTGLGLAAVYGTVKSHQGTVGVESRPGEGSTFHLYLPLSVTTAREASPRTEAAVPGRGLILLVDDESIVRGVGEQMLRSFGYEVETFPDGASAAAYYRENEQQVRLILLDMVMPQQGGRETFRLLQQVVPLPPVLLMSGYAMDSEVQLLLDEGAKGFIQKPFRRVELSQRVAAACCGEGRGGDGRWSPSSVESVRLAAAG